MTFNKNLFVNQWLTRSCNLLKEICQTGQIHKTTQFTFDLLFLNRTEVGQSVGEKAGS